VKLEPLCSVAPDGQTVLVSLVLVCSAELKRRQTPTSSHAYGDRQFEQEWRIDICI
jgi:hypothetical protein